MGEISWISYRMRLEYTVEGCISKIYLGLWLVTIRLCPDYSDGP